MTREEVEKRCMWVRAADLRDGDRLRGCWNRPGPAWSPWSGQEYKDGNYVEKGNTYSMATYVQNKMWFLVERKAQENEWGPVGA